MMRHFVNYLGKESPEINNEEFYKMKTMMESFYTVGRIHGQHQPLRLTLDWSVYFKTNMDLEVAHLLFEMLNEFYSAWKGLVFDVIHSGAKFDDEFVEMEI